MRRLPQLRLLVALLLSAAALATAGGERTAADAFRGGALERGEGFTSDVRSDYDTDRAAFLTDPNPWN